jgi:hypothetical protein
MGREHLEPAVARQAKLPSLPVPMVDCRIVLWAQEARFFRDGNDKPAVRKRPERAGAAFFSTGG